MVMDAQDKSKDIRIMIVDDFAGMRTILKQTLHLLGYERIVEARGGQDALLKLQSEPCDLIISDWSMPNMTGLQFLSALQEDPLLKKVPFLMMTAKSERSNVIEAAHAGVTHYMIKPFSAEALQDKLEAILRTTS
jgi:two-component system chemotaxis response regulator CheY